MRSLALIWAFAAVAASPPSRLSAQQQSRVVGIVVDTARHRLQDVEVIINRREVRGVTTAAGVFAFDVAATDSTIAFRRIGYRPALFSIRPLPRSGDTIIISLEPSAIQLTEVTVSAEATKPVRYAFTTKYDDVFRRRRLGLGTLVTRETVDARLGASTDQLLDGVAGVRVWNGPPKRIRFARCQEPGGITIFINGVRQIASVSADSQDTSGLIFKPSSGPRSFPADMEPEIEVLQRINPGDIEMIEVFRGPSEIPAEFHWNGCAVIAIWTREK